MTWPRQLVNNPSLGLMRTVGYFLSCKRVNRGHQALPTQKGTRVRQSTWGFSLNRCNHCRMTFHGGFA